MSPFDLDLISFGEALVDFVPAETGCLLRHVSAFAPKLGGAPANLAFGAARLGARTAFLSRLGDDEFGHLILERLRAEGVDTSAVTFTRDARTGITFIQIAPDGDRSFLFYRVVSAETTFTPQHLDLDLLRRARILNTGTNLLMAPHTRDAHRAAVDAAHRAGALLSMDANLRPHLWPDRTRLLPTVLDALQPLHLLKVNDDEHRALFKDLSPQDAFQHHLRPRGLRALVVTHDARGASVFTAACQRHAPAPPIHPVDTTGAGDAFRAALRTALARAADDAGAHAPGDLPDLLDRLDGDAWQRLLTFACAIGSAVCTGFGATDALPARDDAPWHLLNTGHNAPTPQEPPQP